MSAEGAEDVAAIIRNGSVGRSRGDVANRLFGVNEPDLDFVRLVEEVSKSSADLTD